MGNSDGHTRKLSDWDHPSHERFFDYYATASQSQETLQRFHSARDPVLTLIQSDELAARPLEVADIGCGAGTQCILWAESGHRVHGVDVNGPLLDLARDRAASAGHSIDFRVGSAVELPWPNESMDVCLALELLEHVAEWQTCLDECARILRPGGIMVLATSNYNVPRKLDR